MTIVYAALAVQAAMSIALIVVGIMGLRSLRRLP